MSFIASSAISRPHSSLISSQKTIAFQQFGMNYFDDEQRPPPGYMQVWRPVHRSPSASVAFIVPTMVCIQ
ncbi:hypothetical protein L2E82_51070 [Cichorium intybus]|nr:hypothetical protein L2E82_51070 [Cichorium intybus]